MLSLNELLTEIQRRRLIILSHGSLWHPNGYCPLQIRRAIKQYRRQLVAFIETSDAVVCPSPRLHKRSWRRYGKGAYTCMVCHRLRQDEQQRLAPRQKAS